MTKLGNNLPAFVYMYIYIYMPILI